MIRHKKTFLAITLIHFLITIAAAIGAVTPQILAADGLAPSARMQEDADMFYSLFMLFASPLLLIADIFIFELFDISYKLALTLGILICNSALVAYTLTYLFERIRRVRPAIPVPIPRKDI